MTEINQSTKDREIIEIIGIDIAECQESIKELQKNLPTLLRIYDKKITHPYETLRTSGVLKGSLHLAVVLSRQLVKEI
jgi:hypothetical protein